MASLSPSSNDREFDLIFKQAWNWYSHGVNLGLTGFNPPSLNDKIYDLYSKIAYYTARIVDSS